MSFLDGYLIVFKSFYDGGKKLFLCMLDPQIGITFSHVIVHNKFSKPHFWLANMNPMVVLEAAQGPKKLWGKWCKILLNKNL